MISDWLKFLFNDVIFKNENVCFNSVFICWNWEQFFILIVVISYFIVFNLFLLIKENRKPEGRTLPNFKKFWKYFWKIVKFVFWIFLFESNAEDHIFFWDVITIKCRIVDFFLNILFYLIVIGYEMNVIDLFDLLNLSD